MLPTAISFNHTHKLADVVIPDSQLRQPILGEGWPAHAVLQVGNVEVLVLNQSTKVHVTALAAEGCVKRDDEVRHVTEPLYELLLLSRAFPPTGLEIDLLGLSYHLSLLLVEPPGCPEVCDVSIQQVGVVRVVDSA